MTDKEYVVGNEKAIFLSFIEEGVMNPEYYGYVGGRIEVSYPGELFTSEEIRFFTKKVNEFEAFREEWDFKYVTEEQLNFVRDTTESKFYDI